MTKQLNQIQVQDRQLIWIGGIFSHLKAMRRITPTENYTLILGY